MRTKFAMCTLKTSYRDFDITMSTARRAEVTETNLFVDDTDARMDWATVNSEMKRSEFELTGEQ